MGILTKEVEVKPNGKMIQYYRDKGYDANYNRPLMVKVEDLPRKSEAIVQVLCDICKEKITPVKYVNYNKSIDNTGSYACRECSYIKKEQTNAVRYGDVYVKTDEFKEKRKKTYINNLGVESPLQNKEIAAKIRSTNLQKYGCVSPSQVPEFKEKAKLTALEHFGVDNAAKSEEVKEKIRQTNLQKYGVTNTMQSPEVRAKANETLCKNGNQKTSKQQLYLHNLYDGELNYFIKYYATDICFPEEKLVVEYDGGGHSLRVTLGRLTQEEFDQKEIIRNNILKREGYKRINIVSKSDKLPSDTILLQMLFDARSYFQTTTHSWVRYDIDQSLLFNAENKNGIPYNYGSLRTIKDSDLDAIKTNN